MNDIFDELEEKTKAALSEIVHELTHDIGLTFRNKFLLSLPMPDASLCWHDGELRALVSFQDTDDGFGDDIVKHVVDLGMNDFLRDGSRDLSMAVFDNTGNSLTPDEAKKCAAFLRELADAVEAY